MVNPMEITLIFLKNLSKDLMASFDFVLVLFSLTWMTEQFQKLIKSLLRISSKTSSTTLNIWLRTTNFVKFLNKRIKGPIFTFSMTIASITASLTLEIFNILCNCYGNTTAIAWSQVSVVFRTFQIQIHWLDTRFIARCVAIIRWLKSQI